MTDFRPRKRFGQHFLHDPAVAARILDVFDPQPGDPVVEIGPGLGVLTRELLRRAGRVHVIEIDRDLAARLPGVCASTGELVVHNADALTFDFAALATPPRRLRVIGNLPYNISTPLLFHLLDQCDVIADMLFMLQREVVARLAAEPGSTDYGRLSVMVQWRCRVQRLFDVGPGAFRPAPRVESAVVRLVPHSMPPVAVREPTHFRQLVRAAFGQRRKTLRNSLRGMIDPECMRALGVDPGRRAETLTLAEFAALSNACGTMLHARRS